MDFVGRKGISEREGKGELGGVRMRVRVDKIC